LLISPYSQEKTAFPVAGQAVVILRVSLTLRNVTHAQLTAQAQRLIKSGRIMYILFPLFNITSEYTTPRNECKSTFT
jgi:hypothetical protein